MILKYFSSFEHKLLPIPFFLLTIWGFWCPNFRDLNYKKIYNIIPFTVISLTFLFIIQVIIQEIIYILKDDFLLYEYFIATACINGMYKACSIILSRDKIMTLLTMANHKTWQVPRDEQETEMSKNVFKDTW